MSAPVQHSTWHRWMLAVVLFAGTACGSGARVDHATALRPVRTVARAAPESRRPRRLTVLLSIEGLTPRELRVIFTDSEEVHSELECDWLGGRYRCEGDLRGIGETRVTVTHRARSGRVASVHKRLPLHGDEDEVALRGTVGGDTLGPLESHTHRAPDHGVRLELVAPQGPTGGASFRLTNGSDAEIVVTRQGAVLGAVAYFGRDRRWQPVRRMEMRCGTGLGPSVLPPGESAPAYANVPLGPGTYLFDVVYDDPSTRDDPEVTRRITTRFEVPRPTRAR